VLGGATLPITHFAVRKWGGIHPQVVTGKGGGLQHPDMKLAFLFGTLAFISFAVLLIWHRMRAHLANTRLEALETEAVQLGVTYE
jgi:heme exporter protein C